jgi:hypothetical protein
MSTALKHEQIEGRTRAPEVEGGVLLRQLDQAVCHLVQVTLGLGLNGNLWRVEGAGGWGKRRDEGGELGEGGVRGGQGMLDERLV